MPSYAYQVPVAGSGPYTVTARLLYQTVSYQFSKAFVGSDSLITTFLGYLQSASLLPDVVSTATKTVG